MSLVWTGDHAYPFIIKKISIGYFILIKGNNLNFRYCDNILHPLLLDTDSLPFPATELFSIFLPTSLFTEAFLSRFFHHILIWSDAMLLLS